MALFPFSLPSANGTPSLHLYLPHLPMSRIFRSRESASDDRSPVSNSERGYHVFSDVGTKLEFV